MRVKCPKCSKQFTVYTVGDVICTNCLEYLGDNYTTEEIRLQIEGQKSVADMMKQKRKTWKDKA